jgi:predicted dehydrogenase
MVNITLHTLGKHVLSEKPIAPTVSAGRSLIETYKNNYPTLHWRIAENFEVEPAFLRVRDIISSGAIGEVTFFRLTNVGYIDEEANKYYKTPWRTTPEYQGGFLLDGGVVSVLSFCQAINVLIPRFLSILSLFFVPSFRLR